MKNIKTKILIFAIVSLIILLATSSYAVESSSGMSENRTVIDDDGVIFNISIQYDRHIISISATNPTDWKDKIIGYMIMVDGQRVHDADFRLDRDEQRTQTINITPGINVNRDNHTVTFSTYGNATQFNFTRKIDSTEPEEIPTPYIADLEITTDEIDGEPSAVAKVTLVNPSEQLYSTKLFVHTVGTDGSLYPASVRPGDSRTITVELLDDREAKIAGEARLYTGNLTTEDGAMDQVEFAGQAGEKTDVWNSSYEPVRPTWMNDNYQYHNDSYERSVGEKLSGGHEIGGIPLAYLVAGIFAGAIAIRKLR